MSTEEQKPLVQKRKDLTVEIDEPSSFKPTLTFSAAIFNMINTIIGSGFLTLPYNFKLVGYVNGLFMLYLMAFLATMSAFSLADVSSHIRKYTYKEIAADLLKHPAWGYVIAVITLIHIFGALTSYAIIIQDNFFFFDEDDFTSKQLLFWPIMLLLIFPLSCMRKLDFLHWCSYVTIAVVCYIAVVAIAYYFNPSKTPSGPPVALSYSSVGLSTLPLFESAWCFHYELGNVQRDFYTKNMTEMKLAISLNILLVLVLYTIVAVFGYFGFTDLLQSDLLAAFSYVVGDVAYVKVANVAMLFAMVAHYPLPAFGMRRMVESLIWGDEDAPKKWRIIIALTIIVICSLCGSFIKEISDVIGFTSSISGSCVVFVFPGLFELILWKRMGGTYRAVIGSIFMMFGFFVMIAGLTMEFIMLCG